MSIGCLSLRITVSSLRRGHASVIACVILAALSFQQHAQAAGATATYTYDDAGRLRNATLSSGTTQVVTYDYDAAGNRTAAAAGTSPQMPPSITVPSTSMSGSYSISWTASTGTVTAYQLYEANNINFGSETLVYSGTGTAVPLSKSNGTYYYRVRACDGALCSGYRTGANPVTLPPGAPASITVPSSSVNGSYTVSWGAASGTFTAYQLYEATNASFTGATLAYSGTSPSAPLSKGNGTYYYRVRACNVSACSSFVTGANSMLVTLPPGAPSSITVPSGSTGSHSVSWAAASGTVTAYQLYRATAANFTGETLAYSGTNTSASLSTGNGTYYYRVRACNVSACSSFVAGGNSIVVTVPPSAPPSITVPASNLTGLYSVTWGASTGTLTAYHLYEATNASFSGEQLIYNGTNTGMPRSKGNGTYYYRVRACNVSACSSLVPGANPTVVTLPPSMPATITVPASSITGSYSVSWAAATGTVTAYQLYEASNAGFSGETVAYTGTTTTASFSSKGNGTYYYRVRACNVSACSSLIAGGNPTAVTLPPATPGAATASSGAYNNTGSYTISWGASSSGIVTAYELLEKITFGSETLIYSGTATGFAVSGRGEGIRSYRVRACNGPGCSDYNATQGNGAVVMVDMTAPTPPASLNRTTHANLYWGGGGGSTDTNGSGVETWRVYRSGTHVGTTVQPTQAFNDSAAPSNATYSYTVRTVDRAGNLSAPSPTLTFYLDTIPPNAPTGLTATAIDSQTVQLSWTPATDPNGGSVGSYYVWRNGGMLHSASSNSFVDTPVAASTTYTYTVVAYDSDYNSSAHSAPASVTTPAALTVPTTPMNLRATGTPTAKSYSIYWTGSSGPVSYYVLEENGVGVQVTTASKAYNNKPTGTYQYRVKACSATNACSAFTAVFSKDVCNGPCQ